MSTVAKSQLIIKKTKERIILKCNELFETRSKAPRIFPEKNSIENYKYNFSKLSVPHYVK